MAYALPTAPKISGVTFALQRMQARNPVRDGGHQGVDMGESFWTAQIDTTALTRAQSGEYAAWFAKLRGTLRTAYIYDAERPRPINYHSTAQATTARIGVTTRKIGLSATRIARSPFAWGSPWVSAVDRATALIILNGCSPLAVFSPGDYLAWDDGPTRRLHMIVDGYVANSGGVARLTVEPPPPETVSASLPVVAIIEKATAEMVILNPQKPWNVQSVSHASFQAVQVLRRF
jgi:hypothetical protein